MLTVRNQREIYMLHLIEVERHILSLYNNMNLNNKSTFENTIKEEIKKENELLKSLNVTNKNSKLIYNDFVKGLNNTIKSDYDIDIKDEDLKKQFFIYLDVSSKEKSIENELILKRFESYLIKELSKDMTPSTEKDKDLKEKQDIATINHNLVIDHKTSIIRFLGELYKETDDLKTKTEVLKQRNRILYTEKELEDEFYNNKLVIDSHTKLLNNNFDKELVNKIYTDYIINEINNQGKIIRNYDNLNIYDKDNQRKLAIETEILKAGLYLLTTKDLHDIYTSYTTTNLKNNKPSTKRIEKAIQDTINYKQNEVKQKKVNI